jgi:hypothetical protein
MSRHNHKSARLHLEKLEDRRVPSVLGVPPGLLRATEVGNPHAAVHARVAQLLDTLPPVTVNTSAVTVEAARTVEGTVAVETPLVGNPLLEVNIKGGPKTDNPGQAKKIEIISPAAEIEVGAAPSPTRLEAEMSPRGPIETIETRITPRAQLAGTAAESDADFATVPSGPRGISAPLFASSIAPVTPTDVVFTPTVSLPSETRSTESTGVSLDLGTGMMESGTPPAESATRDRPVSATGSPASALTLLMARSQGLADEALELPRFDALGAPVSDDANLGLAIQQFLQQLDDLGREVARALSGHGWLAWALAGAMGAAGLELMRRRLRQRTAAAAVGAHDDVSLTSVPGLPGPFSNEQP